jgi:arabinogalactan oligomer / maltooligosaccharide transport system substrate-binding protein
VKKLLVVVLMLIIAGGAAHGRGLIVWTTFDDRTLEWLEAEAASFSETFGVTVEVVRLGIDELRQRALLHGPKGEAADLFVGVQHDLIPDLALGDMADDMGAFATAAYLADLSEQARSAYSFRGRLVGLPMYVEGPALIVNEELVDAVPGSYEELTELASELSAAGTTGFMWDAPNFYFSFAWLATFGGYVFGSDASGTPLAEDVGLDNEGAVRGAQALKDLRFEHGLVPDDVDYAVASGRFAEGSLAMIYDGPWAIGRYLAAGRIVSVHPMPPLADGTPWSGFMGVHGLVLNPFSARRSDAANLAKWITRPEAQVAMARRAGRIPASIGALTRVGSDQLIAGFGLALLDSVPMPSIPQMSGVWGAMADALWTILESEDSDVEAALRRAADDIRGR